MPKRLTYDIITGNDPRAGICLYYSPFFEMNICRRSSCLSGARTKKDPAFKGFRQSSSRLKRASPIAASLYRLLPAQAKQYALYRKLTGEAIKMLKEGMEAVLITETLKKKYIDPLLDSTKRNKENRAVRKPMTDRTKGLNVFTNYPPMASTVSRMIRTGPSLLLQKISGSQSLADYLSTTDSNPQLKTISNLCESPGKEPKSVEKPKPRAKTTDGLIYLGRVPESKKLKIWLRPVASSNTDSRS